MITPLLLLLATAATPAADVAVVCPPDFTAELAPWIEHRKQQGHRISFVDGRGTAEEIAARIKQLAKRASLTHVVLVGDVPPVQGRLSKVTVASFVNTVPTFHVSAEVNVRWGSEPEIASDQPYSDLDGDQLPDIAVGRIPADSRADLRNLVRKIIAYETSNDYGPWRRRVNFIAGLGGFGAIADAALETAAKKLITDGVPASYSTSMTQASWRSPYCPDPRDFRGAVLGRLNEGCLFWVYIGHGHRRQVDWVHVPGGAFPIFEQQDAAQLHCQSGSPIACFLACYAGAYDHAEDCLAEDMLSAPGGPVAVYAGSRVTMPYAMAVMGLGMLESCFGETPPATLGETVTLTKRRMMATEDLPANRKALDGIAALISPAPADLAAERREHLYLFNLLGDPLLRMPQPHRIQLVVPNVIKPGESITIEGTSDVTGNATIELIVRRDRLTFKAPLRPKFEPTSSFLSGFNEIYAKANNPQFVATQLQVTDSKKFTCSLNAPADASGPCHIRAFIEGEEACAVGHCDLDVGP